MVEFSQSSRSNGDQNEEKYERPQNFHNKPHLEFRTKKKDDEMNEQLEKMRILFFRNHKKG